MKSFTLSDINVAFPDADTASITYKVTFDASMDGKDISGKYTPDRSGGNRTANGMPFFHSYVKGRRNQVSQERSELFR